MRVEAGNKVAHVKLDAEDEEDLGAFVRRSGPADVDRLLRERGLSLGDACPCSNPGRRHTILATVMDNGTNWERLVRSRLDDMVSQVGLDPDTPDYGARIIFGEMFGGEDGGARVVRDALQHRDDEARVVFDHPAVEVFLRQRSGRPRALFAVSFALYLAFLAAYTAHHVNLFYLKLRGKPEGPVGNPIPGTTVGGPCWVQIA